MKVRLLLCKRWFAYVTLFKLVSQENIDLMVLVGRLDGLRGLSSDLTKDLFRRATCEVVLDYIADEK